MARRRRSYDKPKKELTWIPHKSFTPFLASSWNVTHYPYVLNLDFDHETTLVRTRGTVQALTNSSNAMMQLTLGGMILPRQFAASLDSDDLPNPEMPDEGDDYFFYETFACVNNQITAITGRTIDNKAKRRIERGSSIVILARITGVNNTPSNAQAFIGLNLRHLFQG